MPHIRAAFRQFVLYVTLILISAFSVALAAKGWTNARDTNMPAIAPAAKAKITVLAIADRGDRRTGKRAVGYHSNVVVRALPDGAKLREVHVQVFDARGKIVDVIEADGDGLPALDITEPKVFRGERLIVRAQLYDPGKGQRLAKAVAETVVVYRPHLTLRAGAAPASLAVRVPGNFAFTVGEDNGDIGGVAHLTLSDGPSTVAETDVTVPAGSRVNATLTASFSSIGSHALRATLTLVYPVSLAHPDQAQRIQLLSTIEITPARISGVIDVSGGTVRLPGGVAIQIPSGALDGPTVIEIVVTDLPAPPGITALSPVYQFRPEGLLFARPVQVTMPLPKGISSASMYWSQLGGSAFDAIGGTIGNGSITGETAHFSLAVVGAASATRTVTGVGQTTWISASTRISEPIDFASQAIEVLVTDALGNVTVMPAVPGTGAAAGTFTVPDVPVGDYVLHTGGSYVVTSTNTPDLGRLSGGRPVSQRTALTQSSVLNLAIDGLKPWQTGDQLEFFSTEAADWDFFTERFTTLQPSDTSVSFGVDINRIGQLFRWLIEGSKGDRAFLAQLSQSTSSTGVPYSPMSRIAQLPPFDLPQSGSLDIAATMTDVSQSNSIFVDYRGSQFRQMVLQGNPSQVVDQGGAIYVLAQPGTADDGFYSSNADLLILPDPNGVDLNTVMSYGSPTDTTLPGNWGTLFFINWRKVVRPPPLPGTTGWRPLGLVESISWTTTPAAAQAGPIVPPVSTPTGITLNGLDFYGAGTVTGTMATLTWTKPDLPQNGNPAFYTIRVSELFANAQNKTDVLSVHSITTANTTLTFPPGVLVPGKSYVLTLTAVASTSPTGAALLASAPFKRGLDIATFTTVSGVFTFIP